MTTHIASRAAILAFLAAAGTWGCSSDKPKTDDTAGTSSGTVSSSEPARNESTSTADASNFGSTSPTPAPATTDAAATGSGSPDLAAMEAQPATDPASSQQSQEYEQSQQK